MEHFEIHPVVHSVLPDVAIFLDQRLTSKVKGAPVELERRLHWLLVDNPAATEDTPLGYCLRDDSGAIRGLNLAFPANFMSGGERFRGLGSGSFFVDPPAQSMGFFLFKKYLNIPGFAFHFASTCNPSSSELWKSAGACAVPNSDTEYVFPLRMDVMMSAFVASRTNSGAVAGLARVCGWAANPVLRFLTRTSPGFTVEPCHDWDKLAELARRHRSEKVTTADRSAAFLEWRYGPASPFYPCEIHLVRDPQGNEGWFALAELTRGKQGAFRESSLLEVVWPEDKMNFKDFLLAILKLAEAESDVIFLRSRPGLDLSEYGRWVIPRKLPAPRAFVKTPRGAANIALEMFDYDDSDSIAWRFQ